MTPLDVRPPVQEALRLGRPVVALESTLISHGLPWPTNIDTALESEHAITSAGALPATIAILHGRPTIGLTHEELLTLAQAKDVRKASRRDLGAAIAQSATAATTVAATMLLADKAGIRVFATGGIGGVHPLHPGEPPDISADLIELSRTPVCVVCSGAKSILDLAATLEVLETHGVPVLGYQTSTFPAFYQRSSGLPVSAQVQSAAEVAALLQAHWDFSPTGVVLAQPVEESLEVNKESMNAALAEAEHEARAAGVRGAQRTPFLLAHLARASGGDTLRANKSLIVQNAALAAAVALALALALALATSRSATADEPTDSTHQGGRRNLP